MWVNSSQHPRLSFNLQMSLEICLENEQYILEQKVRKPALFPLLLPSKIGDICDFLSVLHDVGCDFISQSSCILILTIEIVGWLMSLC